MGVPDTLMSRLSMAEQHDYLQRTRPNRRSLLRGGALLTGAAAAMATGVTAPASATPSVLKRTTVDGQTVVPFGRHLAFGADPRTQMAISWQTSLPVAAPFVRIGRHPLDLGERIHAEVRDLHSEVPGAIRPVDQYYMHVDLSRLLPDTTYYYGVGHQGFDPANAANLGTLGEFTTAPRRTQSSMAPRYTFTAFGD